MGTESGAICNKCSKKFTVEEGGGFVFHLLHCNKCGKSKSISFEEIGEPHLRYLKGLGGPYCMATRDFDKHIQENYPGTPLSRKEYHSIIEDMLGKCKCGGIFKFNAPPRCPKCKSKDFSNDPEGQVIMYD